MNDIPWHTAKEISWNDLDYSLEMYITKDDITKNKYKRFDIIELDGRPWEVQAVDAMSVEGIVMVALKEYYRNTIEKTVEIEKKKAEAAIPQVNTRLPHITGDTKVYPYDTKVYTINGMTGGQWSLNSKKAKIISDDITANSVEVNITTGRSGEFELKYIKENEVVVLKVTINSL